MNDKLELWIKTWDNPTFTFFGWVTEAGQYAALSQLDENQVKEAIIVARGANDQIRMVNYRDYENKGKVR